LTLEKKHIPKTLVDGKRAVHSLTPVELLSDWILEDGVNKWVLRCKLSVNSQTPDLIPHETIWYVCVDEVYPIGRIKFYPSKDGGITKTFPHQMYNGIGKEDLAWRTGDICLHTYIHVFGIQGYDSEPYNQHERLKWHFQRAITWLEKASNGCLANDGDPFELPDYYISGKSNTVAFCESQETFNNTWRAICGNTRTGIVELALLEKPINTFVTASFKDHKGQLLYAPPWNENIKNLVEKTVIGVWAVIPETLVLAPWQAPITWNELIRAVNIQGVDHRKFVARMARFLRDGQPHLLLLGFPISDKIGEPPKQIHWQALLLPVLSHGIFTAKGFRTNERGYLMRDRRLLSGNEPLNWQKSENWHPDQISSRGRLANELTSSKILIIGSGAFGCCLSELLARGGAQNMILVDNDEIEIGNLVRHTLQMDDIGKNKSEKLAERLSKISPYCNVIAVKMNIENLGKEEKGTLSQSDIIFNCTANDEVLHFLEKYCYEDDKIFCSMSIGYMAKRGYILIAKGKFLPRSIFQDMMQKWLQKDKDEFGNIQLPRTGTGCWHPAFPARADDIWLFTSVFLKYFENNLNIATRSIKFAVFEQNTQKEFYGIKLLSEMQGSF
jgi:hypothetical protein